MHVPSFWAEASVSAHIRGRTVRVRRFGWSDSDQLAAQDRAAERAGAALRALQAGEAVRRVESRSGYNGADGLPIREEVVSRHQAAVITRNGYGALCLNTPDVLFADIDFALSGAGLRSVIGFLLMAPFIAFLAWWMLWTLYISVPLALLFAGSLARWLFPAWLDPQRRAQQDALARIQAVVAKNPEWHLHLYRTPAGLRVMALHQLFDPRSEAVTEFFQAVGSDPLYQKMCRQQNCFRARLSPKPWRIRMPRHLSLAERCWPVASAHREGRLNWIREYDALAKDFAACRFLQALGSGRVDPRAGYLKALHDQYCRASSSLPLA